MNRNNIIGIFARFINVFYRVKKQHWIFGADYGLTYREGSKYLLEYMVTNHPEYHCCFITQRHEVYEELEKKGIPCKMNNTYGAIKEIARAECVIFTHTRGDILYAYKKKGRRYIYLAHGMPLKKAKKALSKETMRILKGQKKASWLKKQRIKLANWLTTGHYAKDIEFVSVTSDFLVKYMRLQYSENVGIKTIGMPRNDALFQSERMKNEKWVKGIDDKFVITYMPTHRKYGAGIITPTPFANRPDVQKWLEENGVVLLMKNHPTMLNRVQNTQSYSSIIDITKMNMDPQVCIYHSDVLVTDFSSVWMDYLLLRRPIVFYIYDDFETEDVGTYYDIREDSPGLFCYNEDELFQLIKQIKNDYDKFRPSDRIIHKYHKFIDGNSCERYFQAITTPDNYT